MSDSNNASAVGIGFGGLLTVLFIGLKLTHYIDWSWLWVLSPLWISFAFYLSIVGVVLGFVGLVILIDYLRWRSRDKKGYRSW